MSEDSMNGSAADIVSEAKAEQLPGLTAAEMAALDKKTPTDPKAALEAAENILDAQVKQIIGIVLRGLLVSSPGIPPDALMRSVARCVARSIGNTFAGDLVPILQVRKTITDVFAKALKETPIPPPVPQGQQHAMTVPPNLRG